MDAEWGPWIEHDFNGCPVLNGQVCDTEIYASDDDRYTAVVTVGVDYRREDWSESDRISNYLFGVRGVRYGIIRYRIRKPKGMTILEQLVKNPERELEDV